jgi:hypothetical protein
MVLGDSALAFSALGVVLVGGFLAPPGLPRRLSAVASLALAAFFLNPYLTGWIIENVTGPDLWRALWTLPLPVQMTLVLIAPLHLVRWRRTVYGTTATLALTGGFLASVPATGGLAAANRVELGLPRLKVEEVAHRWAGRLNDLAPAGAAVAAPPEVGVWIPTFHDHADPVAVRGYLRMSWRHLPEDDIERRLQLSWDLAEWPRRRSPPDRFRESLEALSVQAVCLKWGASAPESRAVLIGAGFEERAEGDGYEVWVRTRGQ